MITDFLANQYFRIWVVIEPTTTYTYDKSGNRDTETIVQNGVTTLRKYNYDANNELISINESIGGIATTTTNYTYDNNGNMLTSTVGTATTKYTYDLLNQMITTTTADGLVINYAYNGEGLRVAKTSNGKKVRYLYEGNDVILEVHGNGN